MRIGDIAVEVELKNIKHVHLSVHPPVGRVTVSAPAHMNLDTIRVFVISKLGWIRRQQRKFRDQERESPREFIDRESHYVWGRRYLLEVVEGPRPAVEIRHRRLVLRVRPGTDAAGRNELLERWYRDRLREAVPPLIAKWSPVLGVTVAGFSIQRMKTKWGSRNPRARTIRPDTDLARKPRECLEYLVVHELVHLIEPTHNARFVDLMDRFLPNWRHRRDQLNQLPVRHETWEY